MRAKNFKRASISLLVAGLLCVAMVGCGGGSTTTGGGSNTTTSGPVVQSVPVPTPPPVIQSVNPTKVVAGGTNFQITVFGSGFLSSSVVLWNGSVRPISFGSDSTHLTANISAADIAQAGVSRITVQNPATASSPAVLSNIVDLPISALRLNSVTPSWVAEGSGDTILTLTGTGFSPGTVVLWNGSDRPTVVANSSTLNVTIPAAELATANLAEITVVTPSPSSEESNLVLFPIVGSGSNAIERISVGNEASTGSILPGVSRDGSMVAYVEDLSGFTVFLRNTCLNADATCVPSKQTVSIGVDGKEIKLMTQPTAPVMSADGRFVAFGNDPRGFLASDLTDVILRDTCSGVSGCSPSTFIPDPNTKFTTFKTLPSLSADGRYVAFTGGESDGYGFDSATGFVFDTCQGATGSCAPSATSGATLPFAQTSAHSLSANGRYVVYIGDAGYGYGGIRDPGAWLYDTCAGATSSCTPSLQRISIAENGNVLHFYVESVAVSATGRYVAFATEVLNGAIFVRDTCVGATTACVPATIRASVNSSGGQLRGYGSWVSISDDGRRVVFVQTSGFDVYSQTEITDVMLRDTCIGATECTPGTVLLSRGQNETRANGSSNAPMISGDGRFVVFESTATNLVVGDTNGKSDIFRVSTQQ